VCRYEVWCEVLSDRWYGPGMALYGVVGGEVGVQCCGVEGVRGHWSESPQVTTTKICWRELAAN